MLNADITTDQFSLLVTVGSDHHSFDRLIGWVDRWLEEQESRAAPVDAVVQFGTARPPSRGRGVPFLPHDELVSCMQSASVIVMQGGPMGILEARGQGHIPVVVPRLRSLGEVVDDHQRAFCRQLQTQGDLHLAEEEHEMHALLDRALREPGVFRGPPRNSRHEVDASVAAFAAIADELLSTSGRSHRRRHNRPPAGRVADSRLR